MASAVSTPDVKKAPDEEKNKKMKLYAGSNDPVDWIEAARKNPQIFDDYVDVSFEDPAFPAMASAARHKNLKQIGRGSSRHVYDLDGGLAVKIAINEAGREQNGDEAAVSYNTMYAPILAAVVDKANDNSWIVVQKCKEIFKTPDQFEKTVGVGWNSFRAGFGLPPMKNRTDDQNLASVDDVPEIKNFVSLANKMIQSHEGMMVGDMIKPDSLGVKDDGSLAFVDYGVSEKTFKEKYAMGRYVGAAVKKRLQQKKDSMVNSSAPTNKI